MGKWRCAVKQGIAPSPTKSPPAEVTQPGAGTIRAAAGDAFRKVETVISGLDEGFSFGATPAQAAPHALHFWGNSVSSKRYSADSNDASASTCCAVHPAPTKSLRSFVSKAGVQMKITRPHA